MIKEWKRERKRKEEERREKERRRKRRRKGISSIQPSKQGSQETILKL